MGIGRCYLNRMNQPAVLVGTNVRFVPEVPHVFGVVKGLFRYRKTRYRGLRKQTAKLNILFALANLILTDRPCLAV